MRLILVHFFSLEANKTCVHQLIYMHHCIHHKRSNKFYSNTGCQFERARESLLG